MPRKRQSQQRANLGHLQKGNKTMNERQIALYEYLLAKGDKYTPQVEIARDLFEYYGNGECCLAPEQFHDTHERHLISKDIAEINGNPDFEKIIISCGKGVKIANEEEFDRYIKAQHKATIRKLARIYKMAKKGNRDMQINCVGHTVEAFLEKVD